MTSRFSKPATDFLRLSQNVVEAETTPNDETHGNCHIVVTPMSPGDSPCPLFFFGGGGPRPTVGFVDFGPPVDIPGTYTAIEEWWSQPVYFEAFHPIRGLDCTILWGRNRPMINRIGFSSDIQLTQHDPDTTLAPETAYVGLSEYVYILNSTIQIFLSATTRTYPDETLRYQFVYQYRADTSPEVRATYQELGYVVLTKVSWTTSGVDKPTYDPLVTPALANLPTTITLWLS